MKNIFVLFFILSAALLASAQKPAGESEFKSSTIYIGNVVEDLEKSVKFYTEVIGMKQTGSFSVGKEKATELGLSNKYELNVAVLKLEDSPQATEWKLMSPGTKANHPKQKYIHDDTGMQYITILVNNITPFIERIKKNNVEILSGAPSALSGGNFFILVQDPDGTFIELIGPK